MSIAEGGATPPAGKKTIFRAALIKLCSFVEGARGSDIQYQPGLRDVRPLGLFFWGTMLALDAWCELRQIFRNFRVDCMSGALCLERIFVEEAGLTLADFLRVVCGDVSQPW